MYNYRTWVHTNAGVTIPFLSWGNNEGHNTIDNLMRIDGPIVGELNIPKDVPVLRGIGAEDENKWVLHRVWNPFSKTDEDHEIYQHKSSLELFKDFLGQNNFEGPEVVAKLAYPDSVNIELSSKPEFEGFSLNVDMERKQVSYIDEQVKGDWIKLVPNKANSKRDYQHFLVGDEMVGRQLTLWGLDIRDSTFQGIVYDPRNLNNEMRALMNPPEEPSLPANCLH